tara:strand:+ start:114070 stop:119811 length:5742 start_codon:yes stop_codon:yes gene_type:complete
MAHLKLTHAPGGQTGDKIYNAEAIQPGDPTEKVSVVFSQVDDVTSALWTGGDYSNDIAAVGFYINPSWKLFGPDGPPRTLSGGTGEVNDPKEFHPLTPGRWLVRVDATELIHGGNGQDAVVAAASATSFSAFIEIEDPNVLGNIDGGHQEYSPGSIGTSYMAPTERNEFDPDEGWSRSAERYFSTITKQLGNRRILSGKATTSVEHGDLVTFENYRRWKNSIVGEDPGAQLNENYYYNYAVEFRKVTLSDLDGGDILELPLFIALQPAGVGERTYALVEGTLPFDTIDILGGASPGDRIYASIGGGITATKPSSIQGTYLDRVIGEVTNSGHEDAPGIPGTIFFHGTTPWLPGLVSGPLESTDDALVRWDGVTGQKIKNSKVLLEDSENPEPAARILTADSPRALTITTMANPAGPSSSTTVSAGDSSGVHNAGTVFVSGGAADQGDGGDIQIDGGASASGTAGQVNIQSSTDAPTIVGFSGMTVSSPFTVWESAQVRSSASGADFSVNSSAAAAEVRVAGTTVSRLTLISPEDVLVGLISANDKNPAIKFYDYDAPATELGSIIYNKAVNHTGDYLSFGVAAPGPPLTVEEILKLYAAYAVVEGNLEVNGELAADSAAIGGAGEAGKTLVVHGDVKITGLIDPTGMVFDEQDPANPPHDPTIAGTEGLIYVAQSGNAAVPNTLRWINNLGTEVDISKDAVKTTATSTDMAIASWSGTGGDQLQNTRILIDHVNSTYPSISTDPNEALVDADNNGVWDGTPSLLIQSADAVDLDGTPIKTGDLHLKTGQPWINAANQVVSSAGDVLINPGPGVGEDWNSASADERAGGGSAKVEAGGSVHMHAKGGEVSLKGGLHRGGLIRDQVGNVDPSNPNHGIGEGGKVSVAGGIGNTGGPVLIKGGDSVVDESNDQPGIGPGGDVEISAGKGGIWENHNQSTTTIHGETLSGGSVTISAGDSTASVDDGNGGGNPGDPLNRYGGVGGGVIITGGDAGYGTGGLGAETNAGGVIAKHGHGGDITIRSGKGDHFGPGGSIHIRTQHTHVHDPNDIQGVPQGQGAVGDINVVAGDSVAGSLHRVMGGDVNIAAGKAGLNSKAVNKYNDGNNNLAGTAGGNVIIRPGEPDWDGAGPDFNWPKIVNPGQPNNGELQGPWPSVIALDPDKRGMVSIGADHFNGLTDQGANGGFFQNGSMLCFGRVPSLFVDGLVKFTDLIDPTGLTLTPQTENPALVHLSSSERTEFADEAAATLWMHSDYNGQGQTLMIGDAPVGTGGGGGGGGGTTNVVAPFAYAAMEPGSPNSNDSGTGTGVSWTWNATTDTFSVTFDTARADTSYVVVTDEEFADGTGSRYMMVQNKATTGFEVKMYGGTGPMGAGDAKVVMVYGATPTIAVGGGGSGGSGTDTNGSIFIHSLTPDTGNIGVTTAENNTRLSGAVADASVSQITVGVFAYPGGQNVRPNATVNGQAVTWSTNPSQNLTTYFGTAVVTMNSGDIVATHEDGATHTITVTSDPAPVISATRFQGSYPGSQTELKAGDTFDLSVSADIAFDRIEVENSGAATGYTWTGLNTSSHTVSITVADRGNTTQALPVRVRVRKSTGTWSSWVYTNQGGSVDAVNVVNLNNTYPSVESLSQADITYPSGQEAIKDSESVDIDALCTDFDTISYTSPNGQISIPSPSSYARVKTVSRASGGYNLSSTNYRVTATRTANNATTTRNLVVYIAHDDPTITMSSAQYLRSGGADGTSEQSHTITMTSNQQLLGSAAPSITDPPAGGGTWSGTFGTGAGPTYTRTLLVNDSDLKGNYSYGTLSGVVNKAGRVVTAYTGSNTFYTLRGFVSRTITLAAFANEATMNVRAINYSNVVLSWSAKSLPNKEAVGTTTTPMADSWCLDALDSNPTTIRILDTGATGSSSAPTQITIEETV